MNKNTINFDENDKNLFLVNNYRLKADALKYSIIPRLNVIINECIKRIKEIYKIDVLQESLISVYPNFRTKRDNELKLDYQSAYAGLGGKRKKGIWKGFTKKNGKEVQILPFRYGINLTYEGLIIDLSNYWLKGLSNESYQKLFEFHINYEPWIKTLCYRTHISPYLAWNEDVKFISQFEEHYTLMLENGILNNDFTSNFYNYPITKFDIEEIINKFCVFYPIYESYINIAKGEEDDFFNLIEKLNNWVISQQEINNNETLDSKNSQIEIDLAVENAQELAESNIKIMPSIRWQVFERDNWTCVSCGRSPRKSKNDDVILHIDHIIPRSKGGDDSFNNYQTLCSTCNYGKSNKSNKDLRKHK